MSRPHPFRRRLLRAGLTLLGVLAVSARAADQAPDALVKSVADDVLKIIQQDRELRAGSQSRMAELIEEKIVPHFDFQRMTRLAVGRSWRQATPEQQQRLVDEFRILLVRSYSTAYSAYRDIDIEVKPVRLRPSDEDVPVRTLIKVPGGGAPINVDYSMFKASSSWKVYDVTVDGISLVTTYRSTFAEQVNKGGIEGLIKALAEMNAARDRAFARGRSQAVIRRAGGRFTVEGPVTMANVEAVLAEGEAVFDGAQVEVDLAGMTEVDSSAVSLLLEWSRRAARKGQRLTFLNPPANLTSLAALYGVNHLVSLA